MSNSKEYFVGKGPCVAKADTPIGLLAVNGRAKIAVFMCPGCRATHMNINCGPITMMLDLADDMAANLGEALITPPAMSRETYEKANSDLSDFDGSEEA